MSASMSRADNVGARRLRRSAVKVFLTATVYLLMLHWAYVGYLVPTFSYLGYNSRPVEFIPYGATIAVASGMALLLPRQIEQAADFMLWAAYALIFAPSMTFAHFSDFLASGELFRYNAAVGACFLFAVVLVRGAPRFTIRFQADSRVVALLLGGFSLFSYGLLVNTTGVQFRLAGLGDVQPLRLDYREITASGLVGYIVPIQAYVVNPAIIAWGLYRRSKAMILVGTLGELVLYSVGGHRSAALAPVALLAIFIAYRRWRGLNGSVVLGGLVLLVMAQMALSSLGILSQVTLMVQRLVLFPPPLAAATVELFRDQEKAHWAYSFMSPFLEYPYSTTPNFLVGRWLGNYQNSANANFLADGYLNLGYGGMFIETFVFVVFLWLLNASTKGLPIPVVCSMLVLPAIALSNVSAFTAFLSQGIAVAIALGALLPREGWTTPPPQRQTEPGRSRSDVNSFHPRRRGGRLVHRDGS